MARALLAILLLATGCMVSDDGPPTDGRAAITCPTSRPGAPSGGCELLVGDRAECPSIEELCRPDLCAAHDCCFCQADGTWGTLITDCFEGCGGNVDAGAD
jgi:hypothetical protein